MTPVLQTILGADDTAVMPGNCLQAAIASILDLPLDDVPHFVGRDWATGGQEHWLAAWHRWCEERGLTLESGAEPEPGELYLGGGPSPRNPARRRHVAVYRDGELVHDPHPDGTGVVVVSQCWTMRPVGPAGAVARS